MNNRRGGGIYTDIVKAQSEIEICNSTIADNKATCPLGGLYQAEAHGGDIDRNCNMADAGIYKGPGGTGVCGSGNIETDPGFVSTILGNYHIDNTSPCYEAGDPAGGCGDYDIDFEGRVYNEDVDMGADEYWP